MRPGADPDFICWPEPNDWSANEVRKRDKSLAKGYARQLFEFVPDVSVAEDYNYLEASALFLNRRLSVVAGQYAFLYLEPFFPMGSSSRRPASRRHSYIFSGQAVALTKQHCLPAQNANGTCFRAGF